MFLCLYFVLFHFCIMGFKFPPLTSCNYSTWKDIAWSRLMQKGLSLYVDGTITKPTDAKELIDWKNLDR